MWRTAEPEDDASLIAHCLRLYEEDPGPHPVAPAQVRRTLGVFREEPARGRAVVLDLAGHIAGYALLAAFWSNELGGELCYVDELYVEASARGQGHAQNLIRSLIAGTGPWAGRPVAIDLEVRPENHRARALYERLGFAISKNNVMRRLVTAMPDPA
jgi:ribosomal protein S18 acetylase RimI-like enzyme